MKLSVTDHALVRWLDRSGVMDIEQLRELLAASLDRAGQAAARMNQGEYLILADGLVYVVQNGVVVTTLTDDGRHAAVQARLKRTAREITHREASGPA